MKTICTILAICAAGLAGCSSVPLPPSVASIVVTTKPSAKISPSKPSLLVVKGELALAGSVKREFGAKSTKGAHLEVIFYDAENHPLYQENTQFYPQDLRPQFRGVQPVGYYRLRIPTLPSGTARIEVRAHDEAHPATLPHPTVQKTRATGSAQDLL